MARNPYSLLFGKAPSQLIDRVSQRRLVVEDFKDPSPSQQIYVVTGVRGIGKTVFLTEVEREIEQVEGWIVVELNPNRDMLTSLAAKLASQDALARVFQRAKINLSFFGFGLEVSGSAPITDIETALAKMLQSLARENKRVLIAIDEVSRTQAMQEFASSFQIFVRQDLPVFLLATGLYENISDLQNADNLTFLYRAPKIELAPLNAGAIATNYERTFEITRDEARRMTALTMGFSFAFQVLGYLTWNAGGSWRDVVDDYRQYLDEYSYEKIWSELSERDREVSRAIANSTDGRIQGIRASLDMASNQFSPYRDRLIRKGIVDGSTHGYLSFTLPLFNEFVLDQPR